MKPWNTLRAVLWSLSGAVVLCGFAALGLALRAAPFDGINVSPWEALGIGAEFGLAAAVFVSMAANRSPHATAVLSLIGGITGGACGVFTAAFAEPTANPSRIDFLAAFPLIRLLAGFAGYTASRRFTVEPPADDYDPRALLPSRGLRVLLAGLLFVVASLVGSPSNLGWLVLATGGLALVAGHALIGQERRVAELERRVRQLESRSPHEDSESSPKELD